MGKGNSRIPLILSPADGRQFLRFWFPWHVDNTWVWRERFILILSQDLTHTHRTYINKEFIKWGTNHGILQWSRAQVRLDAWQLGIGSGMMRLCCSGLGCGFPVLLPNASYKDTLGTCGFFREVC